MKGAIRAIVKVQGKMATAPCLYRGSIPHRLARIILAFEEFEAAEKNAAAGTPIWDCRR
jgi:hypothetical protein